MWSNYLTSLLASLRRGPLFAGVNVLGLALGFAALFLLLTVVRFEASYDRWLPGSETLYRVERTVLRPGQAPERSPRTPGVLISLLRADFPEIVAATRLYERRIVIRQRDLATYGQVVLADPEVFKVFDLAFVEGQAASSLTDTNSLVVTRSTARRYFGPGSALGRTLRISLDGQDRIYRVSGVIRDLPPNTHLKIDALALLSPEVLPTEPFVFEGWSDATVLTYLRLRSPAAAASLQARLASFVDHRGAGLGPTPSRSLQLRLLPVFEAHFADADTDQAMRPGVERSSLVALAVVGVVTLLIAMVNYVNLATVRGGMRAREVAMRKVLGATRPMLLVQFLAESLALVSIAAVIGVALVELAVIPVGRLLGDELKVAYLGPDGLLILLGPLVALVAATAGLYPAVVLSRLPPAETLAGAKSAGGGRRAAALRAALAAGQFIVATTLIVVTLVVMAQSRHVQQSDIGFDRSDLILVRGLADPAVAERRRSVLATLAATRGVTSATASNRHPATPDRANQNVPMLGARGADAPEPTLIREIVGPHYDTTYRPRMLAGRWLDPRHRVDDVAGLPGETLRERGLNIVINRAAARAYGRKPVDMIGQQLEISLAGERFATTVVGVNRDIRFLSPRAEVSPQFYVLDSELGPVTDRSAWTVAVRHTGGSRAAVLQALKASWARAAPSQPFVAESVDAALAPYYAPDWRRSQVFMAAAGLAVAVACLGLYSLTAFNIARGVREVGIRKALGAQDGDIVRMTFGRLLKPVLVGNLLAWPLAWIIARQWLSEFDDRIPLGVSFFLAGTALTLAVAAVTVSSHTLRAARMGPSEALRHE